MIKEARVCVEPVFFQSLVQRLLDLTSLELKSTTLRKIVAYCDSPTPKYHPIQQQIEQFKQLLARSLSRNGGKTLTEDIYSVFAINNDPRNLADNLLAVLNYAEFDCPAQKKPMDLKRAINILKASNSLLAQEYASVGRPVPHMGRAPELALAALIHPTRLHETVQAVLNWQRCEAEATIAALRLLKISQDLSTLQCQHVDLRSEVFYEEFMTGLLSMPRKSLDSLQDLKNQIEEIARSLTDKIATAFNTVVGFCLEALRSSLAVVSQHIFGPVIRLAEGATVAVSSMWNLVKLTTIVLGAMTFVYMLSAIGYNMLVERRIWFAMARLAEASPPVLEAWTNYIDSHASPTHLKSQAGVEDISPYSAILMLIASVVGLTAMDARWLQEKMRLFLTIAGSGLVIAGLTNQILLLMPQAMRVVCAYVMSGPQDRALMEFEEWNERAVALIRLQRVPRVLASERYNGMINEVLSQASRMREIVPKGTPTSTFLMTYSNLLKINATIKAFEVGEVVRDMPFCMHLFAKPGVGKTLIASAIITRAMDIPQSKQWTRPIAEDFWNGYYDQEAVVIDEFLVGSAEQRVQRAAEWLELASTKKYQPAMASVDNVAVGIKGTQVCPKVVITMNNNPRSVAEGIDDTAINGRYHIIIEARLKREWGHLLAADKRTLELSRLDAIQKANVDWLEFVINVNGSLKPGALDFAGLTQTLKEMYEAHRIHSRELREALYGMSTSKTVDEIIDDALRELQGAPDKTLTVKDMYETAKSTIASGMLGLIPSILMSQAGKSRRTRKSCNKIKESSDASPQRPDPIVRVQVPLETMFFLGPEGRRVLQAEAKGLEDVERIVSNAPEMDSGEGRNEPRKDPDDCAEIIEPVHDMKPTVDILLHQQVFEALEKIKDLPQHARPVTCEVPTIACDSPISETVEDNGTTYLSISEDEEVYSDSEGEWFCECGRNSHSCRCLPAFMNALRQRKDQRGLGAKEWLEAFNPTSVCNPGECLFEWLVKTQEECKGHQKRSWVCEVFRKPWVAALAAAGLCMGLFYLVTGRDTSEVVCRVEPTGLQAESRRKDKEQPKRSKVRNVRASRDLKTSGAYHSQSAPVVTIDVGGFVVQAVPLGENELLTVAHVFYQDGTLVSEGTNMSINQGLRRIDLQFSESCLALDDENDIAFYKYPRELGRMQAKTLRPCDFVPEDFVDKVTSLHVGRGTECGLGTIAPVEHTDQYGGVWKVQQGLKYNLPGGMSKCGTPIVPTFSEQAGKIIAIHNSGSDDGRMSGASIVTRELIEQFRRLFEPSLKTQANVTAIKQVPSDQIVAVPAKSKYEKSVLFDSLCTWKMPTRVPALHGKNAAVSFDKFVKEVDLNIPPALDSTLLTKVATEMEENYFSNNDYFRNCEFRDLDLREAIGGLPGILASMDASTSAGYPMLFERRKGKHALFSFDQEGVLKITEKCEVLTRDVERSILEGNGPEHRWLAYPKDELTSIDNFAEGKVRFIFCGDALQNIVFRKYYGSSLAAFNNAGPGQNYCVGVNQYSIGIDPYITRLLENSSDFVAADYKGFDKHTNRLIQQEFYKLVAKENSIKGHPIPPEVHAHFVKTQMDSPFQYKDTQVSATNFEGSGLFFTTRLNCYQNEFYLRYAFYTRFPALKFDEHVRCAIHGDDLLMTVRGIRWTPLMLAEDMRAVGQILTSDVKNQELTDEYKTIHEVTFLGASFEQYKGKWFGVPKESSLVPQLYYTKNKNATLATQIENVQQLSALRGEEFYDHICTQLTKACECAGIDPVPVPKWRESFEEAVYAVNGYGKLWSEAGELVGFDEQRHEEVSTERVALDTPPVAAAVLGVQLGVESRVYRETLTWKASANVGDSLQQYEAPFQLLNTGNTSSLQNMPFSNFLWWRGSITVTLQVSGIRFLSGALILYYMPLTVEDCSWPSVTAAQHVILTPQNSSSVSLTVPFVWHKDMMSTRDTCEVLGKFRIKVFSKLRSGSTIDSVKIRVYTSFPESEFRMPRPAKYSVGTKPSITSSEVVSVGTLGQQPPPVLLESQMGFFDIFSPLINVAVPAISIVKGACDIVGTAAGGIAKIGKGISSGLTDLGLHNTPFVGTMPTVPFLPSMAKTIGPTPVQSLQHNPSALSRHAMKFFDPRETKTEFLLDKPCVLTRFAWKKTAAENEVLLRIDLNTFFSYPTDTTNEIPFNVALLNEFTYWRADIQFDVMVVKNGFQNGRLLACMAYGSPGVDGSTQNQYYSQVLDYTSEQQVCSIVVPYNAQTEFLRTWENPHFQTFHTEQIVKDSDYSLGEFALLVSNPLFTVGEVAEDVEVVVMIKFKNARVAVPRGCSYMAWSPTAVYPAHSWTGVGSMGQQTSFQAKLDLTKAGVPLMNDDEFNYRRVGATYWKAQAGDEQAGDREAPRLIDQMGDKTPHSVIGDEPVAIRTSVNGVMAESKFEFCIADVMHMMRRFRPIPIPTDGKSDGDVLNANTISVYPNHWIQSLYGAWSGSLRYRIFASSSTVCEVGYISSFSIPSIDPVKDNMSMNIELAGCNSSIVRGTSIDRVMVDLADKAKPITQKQNSGFKLSVTNVPMAGHAMENMFPISGKLNYAEVDVPFQRHHNFLLTAGLGACDAQLQTNPANGCIYVAEFGRSNMGGLITALYQAGGDDFRFGVFRPPGGVQNLPVTLPGNHSQKNKRIVRGGLPLGFTV
ncbi:polyprotein [Erysiphe necator associated picorna-like virus 2]|nr:polyprotein [Erysiphe necator associated picorna-like virus 2]